MPMMIETSPQVAPRPGVAADAVSCAEIVNRWIDAMPWMPRLHDHAAVGAFCERVVFAGQQVWVAGDPVAGFVAVDRGAGMITGLSRGQTGQGISKALLDRAKVARDRLDLFCFQANTRARRFHAREGFVEHDAGGHGNEEGLPDILMRWEAS